MRSLLIVPVILLAGCTQTTSRYPSLLPRAVEQKGFAEPVRPIPVATPDAALDARIAEITRALEADNARFATAARDAEAKVAVARGVPEGSERWLDAQAALSVLDGFRAPLESAIADLEELASQRGQAGQTAYPALDSAIAAAEAMQVAQENRVKGLETALSGA
ncbi:hypothetical protein [Sphingomonas sp. dw_22]|uniref:hypothetical protein n=1 Tax=Sphingomonas sp. dw_22 TaxID=2721175 RepID=UPI001BD3E87C|nr:hypothetical protein [Sphingomonas sp. dw_22]